MQYDGDIMLLWLPYKQLLGEIAEELTRRHEWLSVAESCTGGLIAATCTAIPGSSTWFLGGVISYDNQLKEELLFVPETVLRNFGAVSAETVEAMLCGMQEQTEAQWTIAISGVAGPGASAYKPAGTVYVGLRNAKHRLCIVTENHFNGDRDSVREQSVERALTLLDYWLKKTAP